MQLVKRMLDVISVLSEAPEGLTFQQLCEIVEIPAASMHRLLSVLRDEEFVTRAKSSKCFFVGPAVWEIGSRAHDSRSLSDESELAVVKMADAIGEMVILTELLDARAVCTACHAPHSAVSFPAQLGQPLPFHAAAAARTLLVDMGPHEVGRLLSGSLFTAFTPRTPRNVAEVLSHLELTRTHGYGVAYNELGDEIWELSAPIRNSTGKVVAAITVASSISRMRRRESRARACSLVLGATEKLSADAGHPLSSRGGLAVRGRRKGG